MAIKRALRKQSIAEVKPIKADTVADDIASGAESRVATKTAHWRRLAFPSYTREVTEIPENKTKAEEEFQKKRAFHSSHPHTKTIHGTLAKSYHSWSVMKFAGAGISTPWLL